MGKKNAQKHEQKALEWVESHVKHLLGTDRGFSVGVATPEGGPRTICVLLFGDTPDVHLPPVVSGYTIVIERRGRARKLASAQSTKENA